MRGKMLFVSIALLVMLFFVETASAQVKVATLEELRWQGTTKRSS